MKSMTISQSFISAPPSRLSTGTTWEVSVAASPTIPTVGIPEELPLIVTDFETPTNCFISLIHFHIAWQHA